MGVKSFEAHRRVADAVWQFDWQFPDHDPAFHGHFPHQPILPGVFLIEMAQRAAEFALEQSCGVRFFVKRIAGFRFMHAIRPGDACALLVDWSASDSAPASGIVTISANFSKPGGRVARGRLVAATALSEGITHAR